MTRQPEPCAICGVSPREAEVRPGLIRWAGEAFRVTSAPRCTDREGCRKRVEANGDAWDVDDAPELVR